MPSKGDALTLFSDGVTEELNPAGEEYGEARLADLIVRSARRARQASTTSGRRCSTGRRSRARPRS
jgi:serine phosphatase RsbU (regulator of sigma subunit)